MKILDLNLFLYAINRDSEVHARARAFVESALSGDEAIGIPWAVVLGFLRLATNARVFPAPLSVPQAIDAVDRWFYGRSVTRIGPGEHHWEILRDLLREHGTTANLTTDAHLAALAIERGAELCSADSDFARFRELRWTNPLAQVEL
jgi:toxin-antitoxin system PIN domain toxin